AITALPNEHSRSLHTACTGKNGFRPLVRLGFCGVLCHRGVVTVASRRTCSCLGAPGQRGDSSDHSAPAVAVSLAQFPLEQAGMAARQDSGPLGNRNPLLRSSHSDRNPAAVTREGFAAAPLGAAPENLLDRSAAAGARSENHDAPIL